jgi:hypothetical protein
MLGFHDRGITDVPAAAARSEGLRLARRRTSAGTPPHGRGRRHRLARSGGSAGRLRKVGAFEFWAARLARLSLVLVAVLLAACSSKSTTSQVACILPGGCTLSTGVTSATLGAVQADCADGRGTVASSCPTTGLIGCCTLLSEGDVSEILCVYGDGGVEGDASATTQCSRGSEILGYRSCERAPRRVEGDANEGHGDASAPAGVAVHVAELYSYKAKLMAVGSS